MKFKTFFENNDYKNRKNEWEKRKKDYLLKNKNRNSYLNSLKTKSNNELINIISDLLQRIDNLYTFFD
jgi:hypothetical protein